MSKEFLAQLEGLLESFRQVKLHWKDFWLLWQKAAETPGTAYPSLPSQWRQFQEAFQKAAQKLLEAEQHLPPPEELPRLGPKGLVAIYYGVFSFQELFERYRKFFADWLPGITNTQNPGAWVWNTEFDRRMESFDLAIQDVEEALETYRDFLCKQEAKRLAERLRSPVSSGQSVSSGVTSSAPGSASASGGQASAGSEAAQPTKQAEPEFVFRKQGELWFIRAFGEEGFFSDLEGFRYISELIQFRSRRITELAADPEKVRSRKILSTPSEKGQPRKGRSLESGGLDWEEAEGISPLGYQANAIDQKARSDYQTRLKEIEEEIAEAERIGDIGRLEALQREKDTLLQELFAVPKDQSKKRLVKRVAKNLEKALKTLAQGGMAKTSDHFRVFISRTREFYSYQPVPPISWNNPPNSLPQK